MIRVGGTDTVRGIAYQQAQAVLAALDVLAADDLGALRVEGTEDVIDIEIFTVSDTVRHAKQIKTRCEPYTWGEAELLAVLRRWAELPSAHDASFEFVTDGRLGPTGEGLRDALQNAGQGQLQPLAGLLGEPIDSEIVAALARATLHVDPVGVGALLLRAEREVAAMLPNPRTPEDVREQARAAVGELFLLLFDRAGQPNPIDRVVSRDEIAASLGVPADQSSSQRWPGDLRERYLGAARALPLDTVVATQVEPHSSVLSRMRRLADGDENDALDVVTLLHQDGPAMLVGRTGTGKSTATRILCRDAAENGTVVLVARAETYLPGRLDALVADAIADILAEDLPFSTGRQALADRDVVLVIDGVSEVPAPVREGLHDDLLAAMAGGKTARVVLVGRDIAALRAVLPSSVEPASFRMSELDKDRRFHLAHQTLGGTPAAGNGPLKSDDLIRTLVAQVEHALGDGSGNPLLFTMGLSLVNEGVPFTSRATLYSGFIESLAERSGAAGIVVAAAALGIVFSGLLDDSRRYADPYEWHRLLHEAASKLESVGPPADASDVDAAARRSGLITPIRYTQTMAPMHDSFADYLAGLAHARGLAPYPPHLQAGDEQRVLFSAEIGGVDAKLATLAARDLPFSTVRLSEFDRRPLTDDTPSEVDALLRQLVPVASGSAVVMWQTNDGRSVAILLQDGSDSRWVDESTGKELLVDGGHGVVVDAGGPLVIAVRLWRRCLQERLRTQFSLGPPRPLSISEACSSFEGHAQEVAEATAALIVDIAPPTHRGLLAERIGPLGIEALIQPAVHRRSGEHWPVAFRRIDGVSVTAVADLSEIEVANWGMSSVDSLIAKSPRATASARVQDAISALTTSTWL